MKYALPFVLLALAGCQYQSPPPVYTAEEAKADAFCRSWLPEGDAKASGYADPMRDCMQNYIRDGRGRKWRNPPAFQSGHPSMRLMA